MNMVGGQRIVQFVDLQVKLSLKNASRECSIQAIQIVHIGVGWGIWIVTSTPQ